MDPEDNIFSQFLRPWLEQLCREMVRNGFRAILILTGHYGAAQQIIVRETAVRMTRALSIPVLGTPEYMLALDEDYVGDHAAWGETSLMMHLHPGTVDLSRLGTAPHRGVFGRDPKTDAKPEDGRRITDTIVLRLATLAKKMPSWDSAKLDRFVAAEDALVTKQLTASRGNGPIWAGWKNNAVAMRDYGRLLSDEKFEDIIAAVSRL
ncbi:MAG: creatininase family protein [Phycisphaerae bacterium]|nr:creatininase family protein [Phycisphaerae bacterium]